MQCWRLAAATAHSDMATHLLDTAVKEAENSGGPDLVVDQVLAHGSRREVLLKQAEKACELVLGRRHSTLARVATGSTTSAMATHAPCRVVCVPTAWDPAVSHRRVVAGVDGSPASAAVLSAAFEAASQRNATLTLICAWRPEGPYSTLIDGPAQAAEWVRHAQRQLTDLSSGARADHPEVQVTTAAEYELTATALTDATRSADLMVIGRTGHRAPSGLMLGSIAHTLLRTAACPLEIVPS
jgi:nucleotide-binding universal stress UspA family protein